LHVASFLSFEEIEAWQLARVLARRVYGCSATGSFGRDYALRDQIRRAAVSVMANIAEGFERGGAAEFSQFLSVAKGSAAEVQSQLYVALDAGYITRSEFEELQDLAAAAKRCLGGLMKYLRGSPLRGRKFNRARATTGVDEPRTRNPKPETGNP
jgi:four helix bundle protein